MCCVGGVQAATAAQSSTRIAARLYAIDARDRNDCVALCSAVAVRALCVLSEHLCGTDERRIASTASKGDLAFVRDSSACQKSNMHCVCGRVCAALWAWARGLALAGCSFTATCFLL